MLNIFAPIKNVYSRIKNAYVEWAAKRDREVEARNQAVYDSLGRFDGKADAATLAVRIDDAKTRNARRRPF
jgi:hypothetical protein